MELRTGTDDDIEAARAVWHASAPVAPLPDLGAPDGIWVLAVADGPVGVAAGRLAGDVVEVTAVAVRPDARRQGVAGAMVEALADAAYPRGARRLTAQAAEGDEAAHGLYRALGMEPLADGRYGAPLDPPARPLEVRTEGLRLGQVLQLAGMAETGTGAKALLASGGVAVNGEVDTRRGRQMSDGDVVVAADDAVRLVPPSLPVTRR